MFITGSQGYGLSDIDILKYFAMIDAEKYNRGSDRTFLSILVNLWQNLGQLNASGEYILQKQMHVK